MRFGLGDGSSFDDNDYSPPALWSRIQALPGFSDYDDSVDQTCLPSWAAAFDPATVAHLRSIPLPSGCGLNSNYNIGCDPQTMATAASAIMQNNGLPALDLVSYSLARNMMSEEGGGSVFDIVSVGESTVNHANLKGLSIPDAITGLGGQYGEINTPIGNPANRFTSSSRDPDALTAMLALAILSGTTNNTANLGDDQDGLESFKYFPSVANRINDYATQSKKYWVGLLPGENHWGVSVFRTYNVDASSPQGQYLIARAMIGFADPARSSVQWDSSLPFCSAPLLLDSTINLLEEVGVSVAGFLFGYYGLKYLINRKRR